MDALDIVEIEQSAALRLDIAKKTKELRALLERAYPGYDVFIERRAGDGERTPTETSIRVRKRSLAHYSGVDQIEWVLREAKGKPLRKQEILTEIHERGGHMNIDTLTSYLSRYDRFINAGHGLWKIDPANYTNGSEIFT